MFFRIFLHNKTNKKPKTGIMKKERKQIMNFAKAVQRERLIEVGFYNKASSQTHKSKKDYSRKEKHKKNWCSVD
jgi:hypothetical protein